MAAKLRRLLFAAPCLAAAALSSMAAWSALDGASSASGDPSMFVDGAAGFVVTQFEYALTDADAAQTCPNGLTTGYANVGDVLPNHPELQRRADENDSEFSARTFGAMFGSEDTLCMRPETASADPNFHTVTGANVRVVGGIDLDGQNSTANGPAAAGTCRHADFRGPNGQRGIDNQFFRVVGCGRSFQPGGPSRDLNTEMFTGSWGALITVRGVENMQNDNDVEVGFYANADAINLGTTRAPLPNATYTAASDPRFRTIAHGRIVGGVLTSEPADIRFYSVFNTVRTERVLRDARVQMTFTPDGGLEGYLAGYTPVEAMYDTQFGFRNGAETSGEPAPAALRNTRSIGQAITFGQFTCQGAYQALQRNADGHRDPATGRCTSISTQYRIRAMPAFVVDQPS